jgi:ketosteroid isomerase-like protein
LADAKARTWTRAEYEDVKVQVYGDVAIVTGGYKGKGTDSGKPFAEHLRGTDTWVKMPDGKWQLVASHYSAVRSKT